MARGWIEAALLVAALAGFVGCSGDSGSSPTCQNACQRVVSCSGVAYGYSFSFVYAAYGFGYGFYGGADQQQCLNDCAGVSEPARDRIAQCVLDASDCQTLLRCK